jgi:hypothetical protein
MHENVGNGQDFGHVCAPAGKDNMVCETQAQDALVQIGCIRTVWRIFFTDDEKHRFRKLLDDPDGRFNQFGLPFTGL